MESSINNENITEIISVGNISITVIKKDIKNMHLSVLPPDGKVRITVPFRTADETIRLFAATKLVWIKEQILKFEHQQRQTQREYITGESHFFLGKRYKLQVSYTTKAYSLRFIGNTVVLTVHKNCTVSQKENYLNEWYRRELKKRIPTLIKHWEGVLGVKVNDYGVKNMKTRWGTCNVNASRIWINLQLAKKPPKCLEYIVLHEMLHLIEKNHGKRFIALLDTYMPDWRMIKDMLNEFILDVYEDEPATGDDVE